MPEEQIRIEIGLLMRLAGLSVPPDRLDRIVAGFEGTRAVVNIFAALDFADIPPAGLFRPPPAR